MTRALRQRRGASVSQKSQPPLLMALPPMSTLTRSSTTLSSW
ncbi:unnamed protein product [Coregonus sp. 'balchen']|nr:unnamed protein product [Coregonus sp. 'balchen']